MRIDPMFRQHIPILIYALFVLLFAATTLALTKLFGWEAPGDPDKFLPDATTPNMPDVRKPISFLLAMLLVLLCGGMVLFLLWASIYRVWLAGHLAFAFSSIFIFSGILFVGCIWIYKKGALN